MFSAERYQTQMFELVQRALRDIGPRESCSVNERRMGDMLENEWRAQGHEVRRQSFRCHPRAFLGFIPLSAILYLGATALYWLVPSLAFVLAAMAAALTYFELLRYRELIDPLFPEAVGENVFAVIPPRGEVRRRVVVSAHQDSAYEFNLWYFLGNASVPLMVLGFGAILVVLFASLGKVVAGADNHHTLFNAIGFLAIGLYPVVGLNLFFHTYNVVPGAMDDLAGLSVLVGAGQALADQRADGEGLQHTEVMLLACSSEEAGLRGAKRFVERFGPELHAIPSFNINADGIYDERHLTVVTRELTTGVRHDPRLIALAGRSAASHGWPVHQHVVPIGATDATPFAQAGIRSVTLLCQDATRLVPNYHTRNDVIDHVRPQSLAVTLQLVVDMIAAIEAGELDESEAEPAVTAPASTARADALPS